MTFINRFEPCSPFILVCRSNSCVLKTTYNHNNNNDLFPCCNYYSKLVSRVNFVKCSNLFLLGFNEGHNIIMFPIGLLWFLWVQFNAYWIKIWSFFLLLLFFLVNFSTLIYEFAHKHMLMNSCISLFCNLKITSKSRMCNWFKNEAWVRCILEIKEHVHSRMKS